MSALLQDEIILCTICEVLELRLIGHQNSKELLDLIDSNREHLRRWHPWVDNMRTISEVEKAIEVWQQRQTNKQGVYAGVWFNGRFVA